MTAVLIDMAQFFLGIAALLLLAALGPMVPFILFGFRRT